MVWLKAEERGRDAWGCGDFGAPRGNRKHNGIDYIAKRNQEVVSHVAGTVTKLGYPYADDLSYRYVEIGSHRFFYVEPSVSVGQKIEIGDVIGKVQDLTLRYPGIRNHVHYEVKVNGVYVDPKGYV